MKSVSSRLFVYLCLFFLLNGFRIATAQDLDTITLVGRVLDQNGAVIPGATVQATHYRTSAARVANTDAEGRYKLMQLEPGDYIVRVSSNGFATTETDLFKTSAGQTVSIDITLKVSTINAETVVVSASDTALVDTKRTVVGSTLHTREIDSLPNLSRSVLDLLFTIPGITEEPLSTRDLAEDRNSNPNNTPEEAGTVSLAGAPAYSNNFTIDGMDNNDDRAARERFQPSLEAVEEVQVITNQFSAEYGRASGGRINLRTRSGTTNFRGRAFYFFRDEALDANTFRNNSLGFARLPLQQHDLGFTFSGPLRLPRLKSRPVFFVAFERNQILDSALVDTFVPLQPNKLFPLPAPTAPQASRLEDAKEPALATAIAPFVTSLSTPQINSSLTARADFQFSDVHNASVVYQLGRLNNLRQFGGGNRLADALQARTRNTDAITYSDTYVASTQMVNQVRIQFSRLSPAFTARGGAKPVVLISISDSLANDDGSRTLVAGSSTSSGTDRREDRLQVQELVSLVKSNHSFKSGIDLHHVRSEFIDLADTTGTFNFSSAGDFLAGIPNRFRQTFQTNSVQKNFYTGLFVHDEWQVWPRLLLSYGLRYERESIVNDRNNFGPRISIAYRPFDSDRFVLRFGGGTFFNRALLRTIDDFTLGRQQLFFDTNRLVDPVTGKAMTADQRRSFIADHLQFPETLNAQSPLVKQFGLLNSQFSRRLDPHLRIPESYQFNFGVEQDLGMGFSLEANFTSTRGLHLWREFNQNAPRLPAGYQNFTEFLASRDFTNFINPATGFRPIYGASNAGELVRFVLGSGKTPTANTIARVIEFGVPVSLVNLNSPTSTTALDVALAALTTLRPDPSQLEIEQLIAVGNSFYRGLTVELRRRVVGESSRGFSLSFRVGYTLSSLIDDGVVNTSDALTVGDFRSERARSLLDRRHRFVFSGTFSMPAWLGAVQLSPLLRLASEAPFNISIGGVDRNLDDVGNDRPNFSGDLRLLRSVKPGKVIDPNVVDHFSLPSIGQSGNLPRNAGRGPGQFAFDLSVTRVFSINERIKMRPVVEFDNVLNKTVFSFGAEFINFSALSPTASAEQRQAFLNSFLVSTRTMRPRQVRIGLRLDF